MDIGDAFGVVKNEGTACTDYLRNKIGDILRNAIAPEVNNALNEYKLVKQWNDLVASAKLLLGDKLNLGKKGRYVLKHKQEIPFCYKKFLNKLLNKCLVALHFIKTLLLLGMPISFSLKDIS